MLDFGPHYKCDGVELGRGGMGITYLARDLNGTDVAIKVFRPLDPALIPRVRRAMELAATLRHPSIVRHLDLISVSGNPLPAVVTERIWGQSLDKRLVPGCPVPLTEMMDIVSPLLEALAYAHSRRVVHRDLTPSNILIADDGRVLLHDFDIAVGLDDPRLTTGGVSLGTAHYMSPEQAQAQEIDQRSDIYSLGCLMYRLLSGQPPFPRATAVAAAYAHVTEKPAPLRGVRPAITAIVARALASDPGDRFQSIAAMTAELFPAGTQSLAVVETGDPDGLTQVFELKDDAPRPAWPGSALTGRVERGTPDLIPSVTGDLDVMFGHLTNLLRQTLEGPGGALARRVRVSAPVPLPRWLLNRLALEHDAAASGQPLDIVHSIGPRVTAVIEAHLAPAPDFLEVRRARPWIVGLGAVGAVPPIVMRRHHIAADRWYGVQRNNDAAADRLGLYVGFVPREPSFEISVKDGLPYARRVSVPIGWQSPTGQGEVLTAPTLLPVEGFLAVEGAQGRFSVRYDLREDLT